MSKRAELIRIIRLANLEPKLHDQAISEALTADTARVDELLEIYLEALHLK